MVDDFNAVAVGSRLNLHLLRLFWHVAESGSFTAAAHALCISQPAVSKGVRELERQLSLALLERGGVRQEQAQRDGSGVRLTEAGQALLAHARRIFLLERAMLEEVRQRVGVQAGTLVIGASTTVASYWLPGYIADFCARHPLIKLRVEVGNTQHMTERLLEYGLDLAVVEGEVDDAALAIEHWRDDAQVVVAPVTFCATAEGVDTDELARQQWILREPGSGTRQSCERLCRKLGFEVQPWLEMASNEAIARTIASGVGVSILPRVMVSDMLALGLVQELAPRARPVLSRPLHLLRLKSRTPSPAAQQMLRVLGMAEPERS